MKPIIDTITRYLEEYGTISTTQAYELYRRKEKDIPKSTVNRRLYNMEKADIIERIGRGNFQLHEHNEVNFEISQPIKNIAGNIEKRFPLISFCIWKTDILKYLSQHIPVGSYILLDVEKEGMDAVLHFLNEQYDYIFKSDIFISVKEFLPQNIEYIIVRLLVSEAPIYRVENVPVPKIEKMLVDFVCDEDVFGFLKGNELINVWRNAFTTFIINRNRLLRYASRRGRKRQIQNLIDQVKTGER